MKKGNTWLRFSILIVMATLTTLLSGCGLDEDDIKKAKKTLVNIEATKQFVNEQKVSFKKDFDSSKDWKFIQIYTSHFENAQSKLDEARIDYNSKVVPILENNDSDEQYSLRSHITQINNKYLAARDCALQPNQKASEYFELKKGSATVFSEANNSLERLTDSLKEFTDLMASLKNKYPKKSEQIQESTKNAIDTVFETKEALINATKERNKRQPNYVLIVDHLSKLRDKLNQANQLITNAKNRFEELDTSRIEIIDDIEISYIGDYFSSASVTILVIENEKSRHRTISISENEFFNTYQDLIGMTIYSKPYGYFNSEAVKSHTPGGMNLIAEPTMIEGVPTGYNRYGRWNNGIFCFHNDFDDFFIIGSAFAYAEWDNYRHFRKNNRNKSYFGNGKYGTNGSKLSSSPKYQKRISLIKTRINTANQERVRVRKAAEVRKQKQIKAQKAAAARTARSSRTTTTSRRR
ncbi:hypothetical protein ACFL2R_01685 [Patescibacteria group bacterium]